MIISITRNPSPSTSKLPPQLAKLGSDEIVLIELQGSLEVEGVPDGQIVGTLKIDEKTEKATILIGHHLLEGKFAALPKPLAVIHKASTSYNGEMHEDNEDEVKWNIQAIVKRKIVFSKRPMPVLATTRLTKLDNS